MGKGKRKIRKWVDDSMDTAEEDLLSVPRGRKKLQKSKVKQVSKRKQKLLLKGLMKSVDTNIKSDFDYILQNQTVGTKVGKRLLKKLHKEERKEMKFGNRNKDNMEFLMVLVQGKNDNIDKDFLISSIKNYVTEPFIPYGFFRDTKSIHFYIDNIQSVSEKIKNLDRKLQSPDGQLISIKINPVKDLNFILNCTQIEVLRNVIDKRYDAINGTLNLSSFYRDPDFLSSSTFAVLANDNILKQVISTINASHYDVKSLDMSNNKLRESSLKHLESLSKPCKNLSSLNLESNFIHDITQLRYLNVFPLRNLFLTGNLINLGKNRRKSMKKYLPFLKAVDGFDIISGSKVPEKEGQCDVEFSEKEKMDLSRISKLNVNEDTDQSCTITEECLKLFLEQFYSIIDTDDKVSLDQAYIPSATIEVQSNISLISNGKFTGQTEIAQFLSSWPLSTHDHSSFQLNICSILSKEGVVQVNGSCMFHSLGVKANFRRVMNIIPYNSGFCCSLDCLYFE